jgi:hypothetical protein
MFDFCFLLNCSGRALQNSLSPFLRTINMHLQHNKTQKPNQTTTQNRSKKKKQKQTNTTPHKNQTTKNTKTQTQTTQHQNPNSTIPSQKKKNGLKFRGRIMCGLGLSLSCESGRSETSSKLKRQLKRRNSTVE